jgi:hypothetical protein
MPLRGQRGILNMLYDGDNPVADMEKRAGRAGNRGGAGAHEGSVGTPLRFARKPARNRRNSVASPAAELRQANFQVSLRLTSHGRAFVRILVRMSVGFMLA